MDEGSAVVATGAVSRMGSDELLAVALAAAAELGFDAAVAVVDPGGHLKGFTRTDPAAFLAVDVAIGKAWTAASYGYPTHVWNSYVADPKVAPLANVPHMMPVAGGYPLLRGGRLVGGIGVAGGDHEQDRQVALRSLVAVGFEPPAE